VLQMLESARTAYLDLEPAKAIRHHTEATRILDL